MIFTIILVVCMSRKHNAMAFMIGQAYMYLHITQVALLIDRHGYDGQQNGTDYESLRCLGLDIW